MLQKTALLNITPKLLIPPLDIYDQWWSMGATVIVDDPELGPALSGAHLPTSKVWKTELA